MIKKIADRKTSFNKKGIKKVQAIMRAQFPGLSEKKIINLPYTIFGEQKMGFRFSMYVWADDSQEIVGLLIYSYFFNLNPSFYFLDHLAVAPDLTGRGIGSRLYEFLREKAKADNVSGLFFECLNDDPKIINNKSELEQNIARLKFYEKYNARPVINNKYHFKVDENDNSTLLVYDPLDGPAKLSKNFAKKIVRKILLKKYSDYCPPEYLKMVIGSFKDDPAKIRQS